MAKKGGKSKGAVSAGIHSNVSRQIRNEMRRERHQGWERVMNQLRAFRAGKRVVVKVANPNAETDRKPYIRVDARNVWKNPEGMGFIQP